LNAGRNDAANRAVGCPFLEQWKEGDADLPEIISARQALLRLRGRN